VAQMAPMRSPLESPCQYPSGNRDNQSNHKKKTIDGSFGEERAAIIKFDTSVPSSWVDGVTRLLPKRPPVCVPTRRWEQLVDDSRRFLAGELSKKAVALGWDAFDLFGCDRDKPFDRIDQLGLCWLIAGDRLVNLLENGAIIETWTGARQMWRRRPGEHGRVLAWELPLTGTD
jgi:hypothetical protein